jgi:hypothetical protein
MRGGDRVHAAENLLVFVRPAGEMHDAVDGGADFEGGGFPRPVIEGKGIRHFGGARFEHFREAVEDLGAVVGGAFRPARAGLGGGFHGIAEVLFRAERDVGDESFRMCRLVAPPGRTRSG